MNTKYSLIFFNCLIYLSFLVGFFLKENSAGGGEIDFAHIYNNIILFKNYEFSEINWVKYESSSLPIYYLIIKYLGIFNLKYLELFNLIISFSVIFIFYNILVLLKKKNKLNVENYILFSISSLVLLSPYFRTSTFWILEENIGYLFMLLSIYFALKSQSKINFISSIFFACLAFYSRQSYAFVILIVFFYYYNFSNIFAFRNFVLIILFSVFLIPSLYFFYQWNGLIPPYAALDRTIKFQLVNLPIIFSICLFYLIPFIILEDKIRILNFIKVKKIIIVISLFCLFFLFYESIKTSDVYYDIKLGGGIIYKLTFHLNTIIQDFNHQKILFILISWLGFLSILYYASRSLNLTIFFLIFLIIFSSANIIFQEYFDPMIFILILIFFKMTDTKCNFTHLFLILCGYKSTLLISNIIYYYKIVN